MKKLWQNIAFTGNDSSCLFSVDAKSSHKNLWPEAASLKGPGGANWMVLSLHKRPKKLSLMPACQTRNSLFLTLDNM